MPPSMAVEFSAKALKYSDGKSELGSRYLQRTSRVVFPRPLRPRYSLPNVMTRLPLDVMLLILWLLDMKSLANLRGVSYALHEIVDKQSLYWILLMRVPDVMQALADAGPISVFPSAFLYATLKQNKCMLCNAIGTLFFIPRGARMCITCVMRSALCSLMPTSTATTFFGLEPARLATATLVKTFAGRYGEPWRTYTTGHELILVQQALDIGEIAYGSAINFELAADHRYRFKLDTYNRHLARYQQRIANGEYPSHRPNRPVNWRDYLLACRPHLGNMTSICCPVFRDFRTGRRETIRFCLGCVADHAEYANLRGTKPDDYAFQLAQKKNAADLAYDPAKLNYHVEHCIGVHKLAAQNALRG